MSDSLRPHELQHVRLSCSPLSPGVCSNSCPLSWWSHLRLPPSSFTLNLSQIRVFSNESALHIRWSTYWSFSNRASNEYSVLISFRVDCFDLLAVQGTLKSLHQHHNSKAPILWDPAFLVVQLSHPYMTTGKTIALTFVDNVMSLFNMLSRFVIAFLPGESIF